MTSNTQNNRHSAADAFVSLVSFLSASILLPLHVILFSFTHSAFWTLLSLISSTICSIFLLVFIFTRFKSVPTERLHCSLLGNSYRAFILGLGLSVGLSLILISVWRNARVLVPFGIYLCFCSFFHWSEFFFASLYNPSCLSLELYMLNHSPEYLIALALSIFEYWTEIYLATTFMLPGLPWWISMVGVFMCLFGEVLRKLAMVTAAANFNHFIEIQRRSDHELITHGIYAWFRHPAYVGWFYWALGTQLLLRNPVCLFGYTFATHRFFRDRIEFEESCLISFFGEEYQRYQQTVGVGLPFIHGYTPHHALSNHS